MESPLRAPSEPGFRLIETFGWHPGEGFRRLDLHLTRMAASAAALGIPFEETAARTILAGTGETPLRCRLTLDAAGGFELTSAPLGAAPEQWRAAIADQRLDSANPWLAHKTTRRALYDQARASLPEGADELLFLNERGEVCEGTITNLFVTLSDGARVTPPLSSGLLPGILRQTLLVSGQYIEKPVTPDDLSAARTISMGNSLRGLIPVQLME